MRLARGQLCVSIAEPRQLRRGSDPVRGGFSPPAPSVRGLLPAAALAQHRPTRPIAASVSARVGAGCPLATARRCAEPAWHRRQRRQRGAARVLLRLAGAANLLHGHHSAQGGSRAASAMPNGRAGNLPSFGGNGQSPLSARWDCHACGIEANFASRNRCRACGIHRPSAIGNGGRAGNGGGSGGGSGGGIGPVNRWRNGVGGGGGGGSRQGVGTTAAAGATTTLAQRQVQAQAQHDQNVHRQLADARRREENLRAENRRLQRENAAVPAREKANGGEDEDMEDDEAHELAEDERKKRIEETRNGIPYLVSRYGEASDEVARARSDLASLERASREAKPYKTHRAQLERRKSRLEKQHERGKQEAEDLLAQIETLQARLNSTNKANDERELAIQAVDEELRELLRRAIADGDNDTSTPASAAPPDPAVAWQTVTSALETMVKMPGVPQDWAAQLGGLVEQLRTATLAVQERASYAAAAAAATTASSTARPSSSSPPLAAAASAPSPPSLVTTPPLPQPTADAPAAHQDPHSPQQQQRQQHQAQQEWERRALELAFSENNASGIANAAGQPTADAGSSELPALAGATAAVPTPAPGAGPQNAAQDDQDLGDDSGSDEDDMASVCEDEFRLREGETEPQRKKRIATYLRARQKARRDQRRRDDKSDRKPGTSSGSKEGPRVKPAAQKKK